MNHPALPRDEEFPKTNTRVLRDARDEERGASYELAWQRLIEAYRAPIARTLRRRLPADSEAAVDEFFSYVYDRRVLAGYDRSDGRRFRAYIQVVMQNFLHERRRVTQKFSERGAPQLADDEVLAEPMDGRMEPEFDRSDEQEWATGVLQQAFHDVDAMDPGSAQLLTEAFGLTGRTVLDRASLAARRGQSTHSLHAALTAAKSALKTCILAQIRKQCGTQVAFQSELRLLLARLLEASPELGFLAEDDSL